MPLTFHALRFTPRYSSQNGCSCSRMNAAQASHVAGSCSVTGSVISFCPIPQLACQNRRLWYDNERSGRGAAWRARTVRVREVRGSNPRAPT